MALETEAELRKAIEIHLDNQHTILFLDWDITKPERREECVDYLVDLYKQIVLIGQRNGLVEKGHEESV